jgi:cytochrome b6-f complex iron-sulfur subunit
MADEKKRPSVAEILAAARAQKAGGEGAASSSESNVAKAESAPSEPTAESQSKRPAAPATPDKPAAAKPAASTGGRPSVAEMLAMARAGKGGTTPQAPAEKAAAKADKPAKLAAEKAAKLAAEKPAKPAAASTATRGDTATRDTSSILAAARAGAKPGPVPKSQAPAAVKERPAAKERVAVPPMPLKPEYARPKPTPVETRVERRGFMKFVSTAMSLSVGSAFAIGNTSLALATGLMTLGTARFMFPNILTEPPSRFKVGFPDTFAPGQVETKFVAQYGVWVVNGEYNGQPQIYALRTVCTHLGCTPNWLEGEQKFKCPCHGSGFYKDGINFEGPAPRPLERYAIRVGDDGQIEIDKSKMFQEELGQWNDPASFVAV